MSKIFLSIVIPVYKSSDSLFVIANELAALFDQSQDVVELILVNDSPGYAKTNETIALIVGKNKFVKAVKLRKNQGQHLAIIIGMSLASGEYIVTMDDDLQHPLSELPKLIDAIKEDDNLDAVFAVPDFEKRKHNLFRNLGSYFLSSIDNYFLEKPKGLVKSSFRIMKKDLAQCIVNNYNAMPSISSLAINYSHNIKNIKVEHHSRKFGKSNYTFRKIIRLTLNNLINYSSLPLKFVGLVGFVTFLLSVGFVAFTVFRNLIFGIAYPGFTTLVTLVGLLGGLNLLAVGIIGEYLIRILRDLQKPRIQDLVASVSDGAIKTDHSKKT